MKKYLLLLIGAAVIFFSGCHNAVERRKRATENHLILSRDTRRVISVSKLDLTECDVPDGVTVIGERSFYNCRKLKYVSLPDGLAVIGDRAFAACSSLKTLVLPDSVKKIDTAAFVLAGLEEIKFSAALEEIGKSAFYGCRKLHKADLPENLRIIRDSAFVLCRSLHIVIPAGVELIEEAAFPGAASVKVASDNRHYYTDKHGALFDRKAKKLLYFPPASRGSYTVPAGTEVIGKYAFEKSALSSIVLPDGLKVIREGAFNGCRQLKSLTIPASVTAVENCAFEQTPCETALKKAYPGLFKNYSSGER